jgi:CheY-like chemotaxis protein
VPTVLIVDDEVNLRTLCSIELAEEGYEVLLAADGKEAMEILEHHTPDVIVMDIRMPEMDGIETLGRMVTRFKEIPIILHSAYSSFREDYRSWAAEAYVVKSSDLTALKRRLSEVLEKQKDKS